MMLPEGIVQSGADVPVEPRGENTVGLAIDRTLFSASAVLRTAYKFTDRCHVFLITRQDSPNRWLALIRSKSDSASSSYLAGDFANELIDQQLRERLEAQFADVRTLIVAQAFSEGNLLDPHVDGGDYITDPLDAGKHR